ncbi:hypothetical protein KBC03_05100 [Patescibacteria group bacterium]|nr:hypothetical protein [Patescibacteria group bacterium]
MQNKVQTAVTNNSFQPSDFPLEKNNHIAHLSHTYTLPKGIDEDTLRNGLKYKDDVKFLYAMMRLKEKLEQTA